MSSFILSLRWCYPQLWIYFIKSHKLIKLWNNGKSYFCSFWINEVSEGQLFRLIERCKEVCGVLRNLFEEWWQVNYRQLWLWLILRRISSERAICVVDANIVAWSDRLAMIDCSFVCVVGTYVCAHVSLRWKWFTFGFFIESKVAFWVFIAVVESSCYHLTGINILFVEIKWALMCTFISFIGFRSI